jgi:hypoxanthine phosphoribosyltransferase
MSKYGVVEVKKKYYTWQDVEKAADKIILQMYKDNWRPDYIVGITRGGLPLATILSHKLDCRMETLKVSLRDSESGPESNLWMSEDAFGYNYPEETGITGARWDLSLRKNILIVDDINDTGSTFNWIKQDWQNSCLPDETDAWNSIWGKNVRFAVMTENLNSKFEDVKYYYDEVNKGEDDVWLVYPYESN